MKSSWNTTNYAEAIKISRKNKIKYRTVKLSIVSSSSQTNINGLGFLAETQYV